MAGIPQIGTDYAGYRIDGLLGRGGMSVVFRAENPRLGNLVALKILAPELATDDMFRERFVRESRVAASLNHPNIIPIYDFGAHDDLLYIVMRYVEGSDLKHLIQRHGRLSPEHAYSVISQTGRALDTAHAAGLIHRDIKPANVLIERSSADEAESHVYLADFGLTKHSQSRSGLTATGVFVGTIDYVAPEQIAGQAVDARTDIYSMGCVLYECLTGHTPFRKDAEMAVLYAHVHEPPQPPSEVVEGIPPAMDAIIARALAKSPDDRYASCKEMSIAIAEALGHHSGTRPAAGPPPVTQTTPLVPPPLRAAQETAMTPVRQTEPAGVPGGETVVGEDEHDRHATTAAAAALTSAAVTPSAGDDGPPPPSGGQTTAGRGNGGGGRRWIWAAVAAVVAVLAAGAVWNQTGGSSSSGAADTNTGTNNMSSSTNMAGSALLTDLKNAYGTPKGTDSAGGLFNPDGCVALPKPDMVESAYACKSDGTPPNAIARVYQFHPDATVADLHKLFYDRTVANLGYFPKPGGKCDGGGKVASPTGGEAGWMHTGESQVTRITYQTYKNMRVPKDAAGLVACGALKGSVDGAAVISTVDDSLVLVEVTADHHSNAFTYWRGLHHNITPMDDHNVNNAMANTNG